MRKAVGSWLALGSLGLLAACDAPSPTDAGLDADLDGGVDVAAPVDTSDGDAGGPPPGFRISLSPSPYVEPIFAAGVRFEDGATVARTGAELARLFVDHGATEVFTRISTERAEVGRAGHHALATGLLRAADAAALDLPLNPEISLFGSYGDVSCQTAPSFTEYPELTVPGPWETLTIAQMVPIVRAYAALVAEALLATGARIEVWDLGNEVDLGTAGVAVQPLPGACDDEAGGPGWYRAPDAIDPAIGLESVAGVLGRSEADRIAWLEVHLWPHVAALLGAAAEGIRSVVPGARVATHISGASATPLSAVAFYRAMRAGGFDPDVLGLSFYPTSAPGGDRLGALEATVTALRTELDRPVFIAEVAYPSGDTSAAGPFATWNHALPGYPLTLEGQAAFLRALGSWGASGEVTGIRPWAPELGIGGWIAFALMEPNGVGPVLIPRPGLSAILEGARRPDANALTP
jgi:hypothetical protein